ncbi:starch-binding domain-containing protein 1 [Zootoca vivipara]|uniref:starch-binding domain-containing protein 1 n=1 Tax=Zootoca vivipara TaxID=8524 RepID=UPI00293BDD98|nr:starch-binding domain-containing protein 1 [Zootoca vivipara]
MAAAGAGEEGGGGGGRAQADAPAAPLRPAPHPLGGGGGEPVAGLWPALLVALVAALLAWLWYGRGDGKGKEEAGGSPQRQRGDRESLQRSYEPAVTETKPINVSSAQEPVGNQLGPPGEHSSPDVPGEFPEREQPAEESTTPLMNYKEYLRNEAFGYPTTAPQQSPEAEVHEASTSAEAGAPSDKHEERCVEQRHHHSVDHEEWEIVPEHSAWREATRKSSVDDASSKDPEQAKRVAAVSPMPQTVHVTFRVHYITHSEAQLIAITGDHECLGQWHHYVPLRCDKDGFWSDSVVLPVDTRVEWKFIVVENGKVRRWEECDNRTLMTEHEDRVAHKWWGFH